GRPDDTHAAPATSGRRLDHHGISDGVGDLESLFFRTQDAIRAGQRRHTRVFHHGAGPLLYTHQLDHFGFGADERNPRHLAAFREIGIVAQEAVAGMNGVDIGDFGGADHAGDVEIAASALGGTDTHGFVGESGVQAVPVGLGINSHGLDAQFLGGADD